MVQKLNNKSLHTPRWLLTAVLCIGLGTALQAPSTQAASNYPDPMQGLTGFAGNAKNEYGQSKSAVTGGNGGAVVTVNTLDELKQQVGDTQRKTVIVGRNISSSGKALVNLGANKTIVGAYNNNKLTNVYLTTTGSSSNIIFKNLVIAHTANINENNDIPLYINNGQNYWVDHVTLEGHGYDPNGHDLDKLMYVGSGADYITISNSKFTNHRYGLILGWPNDDDASVKQYTGLPHLTMTNNYFNNVYTRAPGLMRYGYFHVKNNLIQNFKLGFTVATNAKIYSEGNAFNADGNSAIINVDPSTKLSGQFKDTGSSPAITSNLPVTSWKPSSNYSYSVMSPAAAKQYALSYAGAQNTALQYP
ncbi:pectate lyase [Paenibacillus bovis]|uniref:pectate lyase family protein n=1 Tax=Paenibacillus bovis TaxID=1616788 RepID=UPI0009EC5BC2|nr:pectate lyase [Paenibacillus bovis]